MHKFSRMEGDRAVPHTHGNFWQEERTTGPARLIIGGGADAADLLLDLAGTWRTDVYILYILVVSRLGSQLGRYQSPQPLDFSELREFLATFGPFLATDGRHHLWLSPGSNDEMLVYDRHDVIYAYGDCESYRSVLAARDYVQGDVRIPTPHAHHYHKENDPMERAMLDYCEWRFSPLRDGDGK